MNKWTGTDVAWIREMWEVKKWQKKKSDYFFLTTIFQENIIKQYSISKNAIILNIKCFALQYNSMIASAIFTFYKYEIKSNSNSLHVYNHTHYDIHFMHLCTDLKKVFTETYFEEKFLMGKYRTPWFYIEPEQNIFSTM